MPLRPAEEKSVPARHSFHAYVDANVDVLQKMFQPLSLDGQLAMDRLDRMILTILQEDATVPVAEIGRRVGLSTTPCWRRIQKMEEEGVIKARVAVLDPAKVNAKVTVFVSITTNQHNEDWLTRFSRIVSEFPEVVEFYRMSGQVDYLLKVVVPDIEAYDTFYQKLVSKIDIMNVSSAFAMGHIKNVTALPLGYMQLEPMAKQRSLSSDRSSRSDGAVKLSRVRDIVARSSFQDSSLPASGDRSRRGIARTRLGGQRWKSRLLSVLLLLAAAALGVPTHRAIAATDVQRRRSRLEW